MINYAFTTANDPLNSAAAPDCPTTSSTNVTCSAACNADWNLLATYCWNGMYVQYDGNGLPGGQIAAPNTWLDLASVFNLIFNGSAFGVNNDTASGVDAGILVTDPSCVASFWYGQIMPDGSSTIDMGPSNWTAPSNLTCFAASAALNISTATGNCFACTADTGNPMGCQVECPACWADVTNVQDACGQTGDSTYTLTYNQVANVWGDNLLQVVGNYTMGDCYLYAMTMAQPFAAQCSDYFDYMTAYSQTIFNTIPSGNFSVPPTVGPNCPTNAPDSAFKPGTCPPGCQADLANLAGCYSTSLVAYGSSVVTFPVAWQLFVNGSYAALDPFYNTLTNQLGSVRYNLSGCAKPTAAYPSSFLNTYVPGLNFNGSINATVLPAVPTCSVARAALINSTATGACDACSSATGVPANCMTSVSGDPDCTLCGAQFDAYIAVCNETYNDIANIMVPNLAATTAAGAGGDCFDYFNQLAAGLVGQSGFDTFTYYPVFTNGSNTTATASDPCSDAWDSIVQYSESAIPERSVLPSPTDSASLSNLERPVRRAPGPQLPDSAGPRLPRRLPGRPRDPQLHLLLHQRRAVGGLRLPDRQWQLHRGPGRHQRHHRSGLGALRERHRHRAHRLGGSE